MSICLDAYKPFAVIEMDGKPFAYPESVFIERGGEVVEVAPPDVAVGDVVTGYTEKRIPQLCGDGEPFEVEFKSGFIE